MELSLRTFRATSDRPEDNPEFAAWWQAVRLGFLQGSAHDVGVEWALRQSVADGWLQRGCYDESLPREALPPAFPVGTYVSFEKDINVGAGRLVRAHLISDVTVRPTHRRRGVLRRMMGSDLAEASERGAALAALTATEATIYGRFGFGPATFSQSVRINTSERFALRTPARGRVELTSQDSMSQVAPEIFARHLATTPGAVDRGHLYAQERAGLFNPQLAEPNREVRNALHFDEDGRPDGFVCYQAEGPHWGEKTIKVLDLCAVDVGAYLSLWEYLAGIDRADRIEWALAPVEDPLLWALVDPRCYEVTGTSDHLWLRLLDPVAALTQRAYAGPDDTLVIGVGDELGLASGTYRIEVREGRAEVARVTGAPDIVLGVEELSSLFLGGVQVRQLYAVGRIQGDEATISRLGQLFGGLQRPLCITMF